jgi:hypothetical protein
MTGLEKLADGFRAVTEGMDEQEIILMGAATETVLLEKRAEDAEALTQDEILLISAAVVDNLLGRD